MPGGLLFFRTSHSKHIDQTACCAEHLILSMIFYWKLCVLQRATFKLWNYLLIWGKAQVDIQGMQSCFVTQIWRDLNSNVKYLMSVFQRSEKSLRTRPFTLGP